jgi:archaellum biogenesis ATPase FlaH
MPFGPPRLVSAAAVNEVPHDPRNCRSSIGFQVKAYFGLVVSPKSS